MSEKIIQSLPQGTVLQGAKGRKYKIERTLGHGTYGITYLAETSEVTPGLGEVVVYVAIKEFFMHEFNTRDDTGRLTETSQHGTIEKYKNDFRKEANNLARINHPNIVKVNEVINLNNTYYIVMQYVDGSNLDDYIQKKGHLSEYEALEKTCAAAKALAYLHDQKMLHLDLKPKNIMLDKEGQIYIIDFGLSKQYEDNGEPESSTSIGMGTAGYAPTEQIQRNSKTFSPTIDVYGLGATFYKMLTGDVPPDASTILNNPEILEMNLKSYGVSPAIMRIVQNAMHPLYKKRIQDMHEFVRQLNKQLMLRGMEMPDVDESTMIDTPEEKHEEKKPQHEVKASAEKKTNKLKESWPYYAIGAAVGVVVVIVVSLLFRPSTSAVSDAELNVARYNSLVEQCEQLIKKGSTTNYNELIEAKRLILDSIMPLEVSYKKEKPDVYNASSRLTASRVKKASNVADIFYNDAHDDAQRILGDIKDGYPPYPDEVDKALNGLKIAYQLDESREDARREYGELSKQSKAFLETNK